MVPSPREAHTSRPNFFNYNISFAETCHSNLTNVTPTCDAIHTAMSKKNGRYAARERDAGYLVDF